MAKIETDLSLRDVLKYSGVSFGRIRDVKPYGVVKLNRPDEGTRGLLRIAISDLNKGAFASFEDGYVQLHGFHAFDALRQTDDQEGWLGDLYEAVMDNLDRIRRDEMGGDYVPMTEAERSGVPLWFRIEDGKFLDRPERGSVFFHNDDTLYDVAMANVYPAMEQGDRDHIMGHLAPFVDEGSIDYVANRFMRGR